ncbi:MAG: L,D-transpeptidase [Lachnospiraceae bacterium]|nr:L,D-transpeptidase [Lachnospiraceae bacterium]
MTKLTVKLMKLACALAVSALLFTPLCARAASPFDGKAPDCDILYDFGDGQTFRIGNELAKSMCVTNPDGSYFVDPGTGKYTVDPWKVLGCIEGLRTQYSGKMHSMDFAATRGEVVTVKGGTQFALDPATELNYLYKAIVEERHETRTVSYGIGSTYVEVDMGEQMLYYYQNGIRLLETPIVTGNVASGNATPTGVYYVNNKLRNTTLVGRDYRSFVSYWMAIIGNSIGIHDANWRSSFGGSIYQTAGSHGCINIPPANMPAIYEAVAVGTPAVLFY